MTVTVPTPALLPAAGTDSQQGRRQRSQDAGDDVKRRQEDVKDLLGIVPDDDKGHELFAQQDETHDRQQEDRKPRRIHARHACHQPGRHDDDQGTQDPRGHEQPPRIVEVQAQSVVATRPLRVNTQREAHERVEGRRHRAQIDGGASE